MKRGRKRGEREKERVPVYPQFLRRIPVDTRERFRRVFSRRGLRGPNRPAHVIAPINKSHYKLSFLEVKRRRREISTLGYGMYCAVRMARLSVEVQTVKSFCSCK